MQMIQAQHRRSWFLIALIAIGVALLLLLAQPVHGGDHGAFAAILPILFVGIISPLSLLSPLAFFYLGRTPDAPALSVLFQRPPPFRKA
jgi:hypothetical protein